MKNAISTEPLELKLKELGWIKENSSIVYIEKDCVITETYTGKTYSYSVIQLCQWRAKILIS